MKTYKNESTPNNSEFIFIYRIAGILKDSGLTSANYSKAKAKKLLINTAVPSFCNRMVDKYSNEIIKNL